MLKTKEDWLIEVLLDLMFLLSRCIRSNKFLIVLRTLWPYLWPANKKVRSRLVLSVVFNLLSVIVSVSTPVLFCFIVDCAGSFDFLSFKQPSWFLALLLAYVGIWTLGKVFFYLREILMFPVVERAVRLLAFQLFQHIQLLPFQFHLRRKTGETTSTIETAIKSFPPILWCLAFVLGPLAVESFCVIGVVTFICGSLYSLILTICLVFFFVATRWGFSKSLRSLRQANFLHLVMTSKVVDSFLNFSSVKYFYTYSFEFEKIDRILRYRETKIKDSLVKDLMVRVYQTLIVSSSFILLMIFTGINLLSNKLSLGEFVMIHTYMIKFALPLEGFGQVFQILNQSFVKMERVLRVFNIPIETKNGSVVLVKKEPLHIVFENVWFGYQKGSAILKGVSFEIFPNQTLAIIGETGSGKSTIISLLLGFLEPWKGRILVNGHNLRDINKESLINLIGIVPQDVTLFNDTILHNILYANMLADQKKITEVLNMAKLIKTIKKLPQGLKTMVGERGVQLSGGEKQRIGLARAILRQPKLYIFDEATSSLDSRTEKQIMNNIEAISHEASALIITHRLSTIAFADRVILLEKGLVVDKNYDSLAKEMSHHKI